MTIETWKAEFYSQDAETFANKSDAECLTHSIKKWTGALPENLEKHGLKYKDFVLHNKKSTDPNNSTFEFVDHTCALCQKYEYCYGNDTQEPCVIVAITGNPCQEIYDVCKEDPSKMLELLITVQEKLKESSMKELKKLKEQQQLHRAEIAKMLNKAEKNYAHFQLSPQLPGSEITKAWKQERIEVLRMVLDILDNKE
jgi:hypothetical protein